MFSTFIRGQSNRQLNIFRTFHTIINTYTASHGGALGGVGKESTGRSGWLSTTCVAPGCLRTSGADWPTQTLGFIVQAFYWDSSSLGLPHGQCAELVWGVSSGLSKEAIRQKPRVVHNIQNIGTGGLCRAHIVSQYRSKQPEHRNRWGNFQQTSPEEHCSNRSHLLDNEVLLWRTGLSQARMEVQRLQWAQQGSRPPLWLQIRRQVTTANGHERLFVR